MVVVPDRAAPLLYGMKSVVLRVGELGVSLVPSAQTDTCTRTHTDK